MKRMISYLKPAFAALIYIIFLAGCASQNENSANIVAQVNEAHITTEQLESGIPDDSSPSIKNALKRKLMEKWIEEEIFFQIARKEGVTLTKDEKRMVSDYERRLIINRFLDQYTPKNYRVLDQEIEDYYFKHRDEFVWEDDYARIIHLVLETDDAALKRDIRGSKDLNQIIKENFLDQQSTVEQPIGDLGYQRVADFPSQIGRNIRAMKTGKISNAIRTSFGYHYIQLIDFQKKGQRKSLEVMRNEIALRLQMEKRDQQIEKLKQQYRSDFTIQTDLSKLSQP